MALGRVAPICFFLFSAAAANASTHGALGEASRATVNITIRKTEQAGIGSLSDMALANADPAKGARWSSDICVYSATGGYTISAIGSPAANGAFVMSDGKQQLPYHVAWNDGGAGNLSNDGITLTPGVAATLDKAATKTLTCRHGHAFGPTARLIIDIPPMQTASNASYSETLTLLLAPN